MEYDRFKIRQTKRINGRNISNNWLASVATDFCERDGRFHQGLGVFANPFCFSLISDGIPPGIGKISDVAVRYIPKLPSFIKDLHHNSPVIGYSVTGSLLLSNGIISASNSGDKLILLLSTHDTPSITAFFGLLWHLLNCCRREHRLVSTCGSKSYL